MTLLQLRTLWRKQVQDVPKVQWPLDSEADEIINLGYAMVQKEIYKLFPQAHIFWDYMNTAIGVSWYPLPATFGVSEVGLKTAATDTVYTKLKKKDYQDILNLTVASTERYYAQRGQWIGIFPAPTAVVANGIELVHTPIMALSGDADVPRIKSPLHLAIVLWAKLIALGDTDETNQDTRARLQEMLGDLGNWYALSADDPDRLRVEGV